jgi:hypothetical protein
MPHPLAPTHASASTSWTYTPEQAAAEAANPAAAEPAMANPAAPALEMVNSAVTDLANAGMVGLEQGNWLANTVFSDVDSNPGSFKQLEGPLQGAVGTGIFDDLY